MKRQRKKSLLLPLFAGMMLLSGCHGVKETAGFSGLTELDTTKPVEITFWAKNDTNKTQTDIYKKAISDFEAIYPNITVDLKLYTDYKKIYNDVITNITTDTTPNVCITYPDHIATYLTGKDVVVPLDELMSDKQYGLGGSSVSFDSPKKEEIIEEYLKEGIIGENTYALPFMRSTEACYVNKTYVEKLGYTLPETLTWDFVWEVSEAATKKDASDTYEVNGQKVMIPFIYKSTDNMMIQMLRQRDAGYSTENGEVTLFNDTTSDLLKEIAGHVKNGAFSTFKISSYPANFLNAGQCIFAIDSTAGSTWMGSKAPLCDISKDALVDFETVVYPVPQFDTEHPKMISQGPSVCLFNKKDPQEVTASWLFMQYLLTDHVQIAYSQTEGYVPVTQKARDTDEYQEYLNAGGSDNQLHYQVKIDATQMLLENVENTFVTPVFNGSASLRDAAGELIESSVKSVRRKKEVNDEFLQALYRGTTSLYHLEQIDTADGQSGKKQFGPLPRESVMLISILVTAWVLILAYLGVSGFRKK